MKSLIVLLAMVAVLLLVPFTYLFMYVYQQSFVCFIGMIASLGGVGGIIASIVTLKISKG